MREATALGWAVPDSALGWVDGGVPGRRGHSIKSQVACMKRTPPASRLQCTTAARARVDPVSGLRGPRGCAGRHAPLAATQDRAMPPQCSAPSGLVSVAGRRRPVRPMRSGWTSRRLTLILVLLQKRETDATLCLFAPRAADRRAPLDGSCWKHCRGRAERIGAQVQAAGECLDCGQAASQIWAAKWRSERPARLP
jgi:hypothetical protein